MPLETERPLTCAAAARTNPFTKDRHPKTIKRWATQGVNGIFLEARRVGTRLMTSAEAVQRFLDATGPVVPVTSLPAPVSKILATLAASDDALVAAWAGRLLGPALLEAAGA